MSLTGKFVVVIASTDWPLSRRHVTLGGDCEFVTVPDDSLPALGGARRIALYPSADAAFAAINNWRRGGNLVYGVVRASDLLETKTITETTYALRGT